MPTPENKQSKISNVEQSALLRSSTQSFIDIDHINNGVAVMKDGGLRAVLYCSAVNFDLKSNQEQDAIIAAYQSFLNSLETPIQIVIQSRRINLTQYLDGLRKRQNQERNELLRAQIVDYIGFVEYLIGAANIMEKRFYIVVSHFPAATSRVGFFQQLFGNQNTVAIQDFELERKFLTQKVEQVMQGIRRVGVKVAQLNTQELIELYYNTYNPDQAAPQRIIDLNELEAEIVSRTPDFI